SPGMMNSSASSTGDLRRLRHGGGCGRMTRSRSRSVRCHGRLAANAAHRAAGRHALRFADMMARLFLPRPRLQGIAQLSIFCSASQSRAQVMFCHAEKACPDLAVRGEANAVAVTAERFADRRNEADLPSSIAERPASGGLGGICHADGPEVKARLQPAKD